MPTGRELWKGTWKTKDNGKIQCKSQGVLKRADNRRKIFTAPFEKEWLWKKIMTDGTRTISSTRPSKKTRLILYNTPEEVIISRTGYSIMRIRYLWLTRWPTTGRKKLPGGLKADFEIIDGIGGKCQPRLYARWSHNALFQTGKYCLFIGWTTDSERNI